MGDAFLVRRGGQNEKKEWQYAWKKSSISSGSANYSITVTLTYKDAVIAIITGDDIDKFVEDDFILATFESESFVILLNKDRTVTVTYNGETMPAMVTWSYSEGTLSFSKEMDIAGAKFGGEKPTGTVTTCETTYYPGSFMSFVVSDDASAYPADGVRGYYYELIPR